MNELSSKIGWHEVLKLAFIRTRVSCSLSIGHPERDFRQLTVTKKFEINLFGKT
jgi:hypothetical protein